MVFEYLVALFLDFLIWEGPEAMWRVRTSITIASLVFGLALEGMIFGPDRRCLVDDPMDCALLAASVADFLMADRLRQRDGNGFRPLVGETL